MTAVRTEQIANHIELLTKVVFLFLPLKTPNEVFSEAILIQTYDVCRHFCLIFDTNRMGIKDAIKTELRTADNCSYLN